MKLLCQHWEPRFIPTSPRPWLKLSCSGVKASVPPCLCWVFFFSFNGSNARVLVQILGWAAPSSDGGWNTSRWNWCTRMASHCPQGRKCLALPVSSKIFAKPFKYFATHHCPSSQAIYLPLHAAWPLSFLWGLCQYCLYAWHLPSHAHRSSVGVLSNSCDSSIDRLDQHYSCRVSVCSKLARTNRKLDVYDHPPSSILHPLHKFVDLWGCFFSTSPPPKNKKHSFL